MIKFYKKAIIIVALISLSHVLAYAQGEFFKIENETFSFDNIQKITFFESNACINILNGTQKFSLYQTWHFTNTSSSINNTSSSISFDVFPNPVSDVLQITDSNPRGIVCIYNVGGTLVMCKEVRETRASLDLSDLKPGFYLVKANNQVVRIIKK